jgi:hypothetical protein
MATLALIIFLLPLIGGGIYFLAQLVQGETTLPSLPADPSSAVPLDLLGSNSVEESSYNGPHNVISIDLEDQLMLDNSSRHR